MVVVEVRDADRAEFSRKPRSVDPGPDREPVLGSELKKYPDAGSGVGLRPNERAERSELPELRGGWRSWAIYRSPGSFIPCELLVELE